jgi:DeoR/GlpR family transcriptional regulator of sugar metabolism
MISDLNIWRAANLLIRQHGGAISAMRRAGRSSIAAKATTTRSGLAIETLKALPRGERNSLTEPGSLGIVPESP